MVSSNGGKEITLRHIFVVRLPDVNKPALERRNTPPAFIYINIIAGNVNSNPANRSLETWESAVKSSESSIGRQAFEIFFDLFYVETIGVQLDKFLQRLPGLLEEFLTELGIG